MNINAWCNRWGVSPQALAELRALMVDSVPDPTFTAAPASSEAAVQNVVRLEASKKGIRLWRNNVGAYQDEYGNFIRYGLANDSQAMNRVIKSSDLVGIRPVLIEPHHVGCTIGQFVAREVKAADWTWHGNKHEQAQAKFLELVNLMGGDGCFANREGTL